MRRPVLACGLAGLVAAGLPAAAAAAGLQPYQLVRSLEMVQDRIASGDHAAMPMQRKLLEMADARFLEMDDAELGDPVNRRALLVYAMSGGNPATIELTLTRVAADDPDRRLGSGILLYLRGQPRAAQAALDTVQPMRLPPELGAHLALIKASAIVAEQPRSALELLDEARLLAPGTLVEEAALRRAIAIATTLGDGARFLRASRQYVSAYIRSPYASQFADAFVAGAVALHASIDLIHLDEIASMMDAEREKVIYLRIARKAAIDGLSELSSWASARAEAVTDDPRAALYASLSSVTSQDAPEVLEKLSSFDRERLSRRDRELLDAAIAVSKKMVARPAGMPEPPKPRVIGGIAPPPQEPSLLTESDPAGDDAAEPILARGMPATPIVPTRADPPPEEPSPEIAAARQKLADIDRLLEETN